MTVAVPPTRPLVFVGPSAPADDVLSILPQAEIRGPVRRGDLYTARLLRYSMFIVLDGVFAQQEAISPREVVDVLSDGAVFLGGASMGALRAVDCGPAGAEGAGAVWRLFRRRVLSSEDEVGVLFLPERPFPAMTLALVNIRVALRRAVRKGLMTSPAAQQLAQTAIDMHYAERTWQAICKTAGVTLPQPVLQFLMSIDVKRADAHATLQRAARWLARDPTLFQRPRRSQTTFGLLDEGREHSTDPLLGEDADKTGPGFLVWMLCSGRAPKELRRKGMTQLHLDGAGSWLDRLDRLSWGDITKDAQAAQFLLAELRTALQQNGSYAAETLRHLAVSRASRAHITQGGATHAKDVISAQNEILAAHGVADWETLCLDYSQSTVRALTKVRKCWACAKSQMRQRHQ